MSNRDDTLDQLNTARDDLTTRIISQTAQPGTPAWDAMMKLVNRRDQIRDQINGILLKSFNEAAAGLGDAVQNLEDCTARLGAIVNTAGTVAEVVQVADTVVQAAAAIIGLAVAM